MRYVSGAFGVLCVVAAILTGSALLKVFYMIMASINFYDAGRGV